MKCKKPGTDQELKFTVFVNGLPCPEFDLPGSAPPDGGTVHCFIPVSNGDQLTIKGCFKGTLLHGSFDLLVDGTFVADKRIEGEMGGATHHRTRTMTFERALDTPGPAGFTFMKEPRAVEGNIKAKPLTMQHLQVATNGTELMVGTLAVIVSVNQKSDDKYTHVYASKTMGVYEHKDPADMLTGGIAPTHKLELQEMEMTPHPQRLAIHRRHFGQTRFGHKPWAKFIFYYRSRMAIESAGCVLRPDQYVNLEAVTDGSFVAKAPPPRKTKSKTPPTPALDGNSEGDEITVMSTRKDSAASESNGLFLSPSPAEMGNRMEGREGPISKGKSAVERVCSAAVSSSGGDDIGEIHSSATGRESPISEDRNAVERVSGAAASISAGDDIGENEQPAPTNGDNGVRVKTEPVPPSLKRPQPFDSDSRESTPRKKSRISELQAKKAAILVANQEKMERKLAAEKKLEDDRKKREAEEAELLREIAEMEKEGRDLDEATEELEKIWEMENDKTEVD